MNLLRVYIRELLVEKSLTGRRLEKVASAIAQEVGEYLLDDDLRLSFAEQGALKFAKNHKLITKTGRVSLYFPSELVHWSESLGSFGV